MTVVLGLDPGLLRTGWGALGGGPGHPRLLGFGVVCPPPDCPLPERLLILHTALMDCIARIAPDVLAIEEIFVNRNPRSSLLLASARAVCVLAAARAGLPVHEYSPSHLKKAVTGNGRATKIQVHAMIRRFFPEFSGESLDAADALAAAFCHTSHAPLAARLKAMAAPDGRKGPG